jgi:hypothetical protein
MTVTPTMLISVGVALAAVLTLQGWILWRLLGAMASVPRMEERLNHFGDALTLLTETTEGGFRAVAMELDRAAAQAGPAAKKPAAPRPTSARISAAAKRGRSIEEIAATEQLSEGEVRLRLHLAKQAAQAKATRAKRGRQDASSSQTQEHHNGSMRA